MFRMPWMFGYPTYLIIESTNICNLKCPLCPTGQGGGGGGRNKGKMAYENFKKIIDVVGKYSYSLRLENWGEPLLNAEIFDMIAYANSKKISTSLNTNFSFSDSSYAEKLVSSGLDHLKISLDGASQETYGKYRIGGDFSVVIENIKKVVDVRVRLNKTKPVIEIQFIVMRHNEHEIETIGSLCKDLGVDMLFFENLRLDMREELINRGNYKDDKFKDWLPEGNQQHKTDLRKKNYKNIPKNCYYLWTTAVINWDGLMAPCCSVYDEKYNFGNFFKDGFERIWNGDKYIAARNLMGRRNKKGPIAGLPCVHCFKHGIIL